MQASTAEQAKRRLKIIEGQIRGVQRLLDEQAGCAQVLTQIAAVQNALRGVGRLVVDNHLRTCVSEAIRQQQGEAHIEELLDIMYKLAK
jgi:DNA-binding FrmR family transcriptional regulator